MAGGERHWQKMEALLRQWAADLDKVTSAHRVLAYQWLLGQPLVLGVLHDALGPLLVIHPPRAQREPREPLPGRAPRAREAGPPWVLLSKGGIRPRVPGDRSLRWQGDRDRLHGRERAARHELGDAGLDVAPGGLGWGLRAPPRHPGGHDSAGRHRPTVESCPVP
jgi:hypothetical protein